MIEIPRKMTQYWFHASLPLFSYLVVTGFVVAFLQRATCISRWSSRATPLSRRTKWFCPASWARPSARWNGSKTVAKSIPPKTFSSNQTARSACWSSRRRRRATWERTPATVAPTKPQPTWTSKVMSAAIRPLPPLALKTTESGPAHRHSAKPHLSLGSSHLPSILHYCVLYSHSECL